jgi:hypothetical protein
VIIVSQPPKFFDVECADRACDLKKLRSILKKTVGKNVTRHQLFGRDRLRVEEYPLAPLDVELANACLRDYVIKIFLLDENGERVESDVLTENIVDPAAVPITTTPASYQLLPSPKLAPRPTRVRKPVVRSLGEPKMRERVKARRAAHATTTPKSPR